IDARRRLVRRARLAHDPVGLVVPALRTLDARLRQRLRDLIEDERVRGFLFPRSRDLRDGRVLPREGALIATRIAMHFPLLRIQERTAFRTEHEGTDPPKDACDKKLARSELRVIVILQRAFDEPLDRALLGLCAHSGRSSSSSSSCASASSSTYGRAPGTGWTSLPPSELPDPERDCSCRRVCPAINPPMYAKIRTMRYPFVPMPRLEVKAWTKPCMYA